MTKNPHVNRMGMITFAGCMVIATLFIIFTVVADPGAVDVQKLPEIGMTPKQYIERKEGWIQSSPEAIVRGESIYKLNYAFFYEVSGKDSFLEMFKSGDLPNNGTELEVFRMISKGNAELGILKTDHLLENERWDVVHYLRSLNSNLPSTAQSEWKKFFKEGA